MMVCVTHPQLISLTGTLTPSTLLLLLLPLAAGDWQQ